MLTHPTLDQLRALRLDGMAEAFAELQAQDGARDLPHADWLALLLDRERADRNTRRFRTRLRNRRGKRPSPWASSSSAKSRGRRL